MGTNKRKPSEDQGGFRLLRLLLGLIFLVAGATKLLGIPFWVGSFGRFQFPVWWFFYAVGVAEIVGGVLFLLGRRLGVTAGILATVMLGAVATHFRVGEFALALVPLGLLVLLYLLFRDNRA
jgi:putative oxidoreductase